jgi:hypothetical protein
VTNKRKVQILFLLLKVLGIFMMSLTVATTITLWALPSITLAYGIVYNSLNTWALFTLCLVVSVIGTMVLKEVFIDTKRTLRDLFRMHI